MREERAACEAHRDAAPPVLRLDNVTKAFAGVEAVRGVSLDIRPGEYFSLLGDSGCGKTTLLRLVAGLTAPDTGRIYLDGHDVTDAPAHRRPVNMVFQSYALFPHFTVFDNVAFGLRQEAVPRAEVAKRVAAMLAQVELGDLARRKPHQLSGGQQQRVALARALVKQPRLVLLDEPMAALDRNLRERTQAELAAVQERVGITFVMVTHDQHEAMNVSSRIGVMRDGALAQVGTPHQIYESPANRYVAAFVGAANLYPARVEARKPSYLLIDVPALACLVRTTSGAAPGSNGTARRSRTARRPGMRTSPPATDLVPGRPADGSVHAPPTRGAERFEKVAHAPGSAQSGTARADAAGSPCWIAVRPEKITVRRAPSDDADTNTAQARVERIVYLGGRWACSMRTPTGAEIRALLPATLDDDERPCAPGEKVWACWHETAPVVLES